MPRKTQTGAFASTATATDADFTQAGAGTGGFGNDNGDQITVTYDEGPLVGPGDTVSIDPDGAGATAATTYTCAAVPAAAGQVTCSVAGNVLTIAATAATVTETAITLTTSTVPDTNGITDAEGNPDEGFPVVID